MGVGILAAGIWMIRLLATPVPEPADENELIAVAIDYRCSVCGMELTVNQIPGDEAKAPRHCREEMEPVSSA